MQVLKTSHSNENVSGVMCRSTLSVDWQGFIYDCDFNQMLALPAGLSENKTHLNDVISHDFNGEPIAIMDHCYGCTAGSGSSCGGAIA